MKTITLHDSTSIGETVRTLAGGGIAVVPTDTVYGLIADASNESAIQKIYTVKKRDTGKKMGLFVRDADMYKAYTTTSPDLSEKLFHFWPGALTAVVRLASPLPQQSGTIGIRVPRSQFLLDVLALLGRPLIQTSANISGHGSMTKGGDVLRDLGGAGAIDLFVDGGDLPDNMASTIIDCTVLPPRILRDGQIGRERLKEIFGTLSS